MTTAVIGFKLGRNVRGGCKAAIRVFNERGEEVQAWQCSGADPVSVLAHSNEKAKCELGVSLHFDRSVPL